MRVADRSGFSALSVLSRAVGRIVTFVALCAISAGAHAESCNPAAPRLDSGMGFKPFGANEQVLARGGHSGPAWEWALGANTDSGRQVHGSLDWVSGKVYKWKLVNTGNGNAVLKIKDRGKVVLRLAYPSRMDAGNALELRVSTNPSIGPHTTIAASLTKLNGHAVSGSLSLPGTRKHSEQLLYYYFPEMAKGFTAEGAVSLTYRERRPTGSRVQLAVRAGTIPCNAPDIPPTVSIIAPAANSVFTAPATIIVTAEVHDDYGTVTEVTFYANGTSIGTATSSPFTIPWTNVPAGAFSLTAVATTLDGFKSMSSAVPIEVNATQALYFVHVDHLNTPRLITNTSQQVVWRWDQVEPFGDNPAEKNPNELGGFEFDLRFPGQRRDGETGLNHNYFRDFDPALDIFYESDPIGLRAGLNTYLYTANPLSQIDPLGLAAQKGGEKKQECGPEGSLLEYFVPNNPFGWPFQNCCDAHDRCYGSCAGPDKLTCDSDACKCFKDACKASTGYAKTACERAAKEYCYRIIYSQIADEQFRKARAKCKSACVQQEDTNL